MHTRQVRSLLLSLRASLTCRILGLGVHAETSRMDPSQESRAMPSYNQDLKSFAGEESNNNVPMKDPVFVPTLQADMDSPFLAFLTKLSLVTRFGHARAPPSPPPVK
ncbi:unnamed protein product [Ectocarpus sp. 4 AP-2014]